MRFIVSLPSFQDGCRRLRLTLHNQGPDRGAEQHRDKVSADYFPCTRGRWGGMWDILPNLEISLGSNQSLRCGHIWNPKVPMAERRSRGFKRFPTPPSRKKVLVRASAAPSTRAEPPEGAGPPGAAVKQAPLSAAAVCPSAYITRRSRCLWVRLFGFRLPEKEGPQPRALIWGA